VQRSVTLPTSDLPGSSFSKKFAGGSSEWGCQEFSMDAEERPPSAFGDCYQQSDVYRDVSLPPPRTPGPSACGKQIEDAILPPSKASAFSLFKEPDELCKGLALRGLALRSSLPLSGLEQNDAWKSGLSIHNGGSSSPDSASSDCFKPGDIPPEPPSDSFFKFEVTTQYVTSTSPFEIGNHLHDFFHKEVTGTLAKPVSRAKFAIKVDVFVGIAMCTMKVRVYNQGSGRFAIEFQRRSGETLSFNSIYQQACKFLQPRLNIKAIEAPPPIFSMEPLPIPDDGLTISEEEMAPLLGMTSLVGAPWLQAEAAASLCKMAAEANPVLWSIHVFQCIGKLLQANSLDVAHPTACLILHLAKQQEAASCFASECLLLKILDKVISTETHPQVSKNLSQALSAAIQALPTSKVQDNNSSELRDALSEAFRTNMKCDDEVMKNLETAQFTLCRAFW